MIRASVDLELGSQAAPQAILREHTHDRGPEHAFGSLGHETTSSRAPDTSGPTGVTVINLVGELRAREPHLGGIDDHDEVACIDVRREGRLVLSAKNIRDLRGEATNDARIGIDDEPSSFRQRIFPRSHVRVFLHCRDYLSKSGADETRTRDLLRDRQAF